MGTTESIFVDSEIPIPPVTQTTRSSSSSLHQRPSQSQQSPKTTDMNQISSSTDRTSQQQQQLPMHLSSSSSSSRRHPHPLSVSDPPTIQRKLQQQQQQMRPLAHTTTDTTSSSGYTAQTTISPSSSSSFQLNGMVLGLSKSGKRTLLQRLAGKELPDVVDSNSSTTKNTNNLRRNVNIENDESTIATTVNVPYQPSGQLPTFNHNEPIQLHVQASKKILNMINYDHDQYHFYVIVINPFHDPKKIQKYITKRLHEILHTQQDYDKSKTQSLSSSSSPPLHRPFCVSLLRNFCDRIQDGTITTSQTESTIQISDLTIWTMEVLQEYPHIIDPLLQCIDTSFMNYYGLSALHHFIYQSYVQQKQYIIQQEVRRIKEAMAISRQLASTFVIPYNEYMDHIQQLLQSNSVTATSNNSSTGTTGSSRVSSSNNSAADETVTTATSSGGANGSSSSATMGNRRRIIQPNQPTQNNNNNNSSTGTKTDQGRSRTMSGGSTSSTLPSIQQSFDHAKDALEAFLESDSDDDDEEEEDDDMDRNVDHNPRNQPKSSVHNDDGSEDDEDFYLDEIDDKDVVDQKSPEIVTSKPSDQVDETTMSTGIDKCQTLIKEDSSNNGEDTIVENEIDQNSIDPVELNTSSPSDNTIESILIEEICHNIPRSDDDPTCMPVSNCNDDESEFFIAEVIETETSTDGMKFENNDDSFKNNDTLKSDTTDTVGTVTNDVSEVENRLDVSNDEAGIAVPDVLAASKSNHISDAARAAIEIARQDFERMMLQEQEEDEQHRTVNDEEIMRELLPKKSKKDKHKKKSGAKEGNKSKRHEN